MYKEQGEGTKKVLAILTVVLIVALIGQLVSTMAFNKAEHVFTNGKTVSDTYFNLGNRQDSTSSWLKRDFDYYGKIVDLNGQTVDGTFYNKSKYEISNWTMRINIKHDCFINNAWCGTMEIHQFVGTPKEKVQTLDLRDYKLGELKLTYQNDGDLLIPLQKGDFLIYHPSEKDRELNIAPQSELTMGMIFYYLGYLDVTDYEITYKYHRAFNSGMGFYGVLGLLILWILMFTAYLVSTASYKRAWRAMEMQKTGLSYMSAIYSGIYIIDLVNDEIFPVATQENIDKLRPKELSANEQLQNLFRWDAAEPYLDMALKFGDLSTLNERMDKNSIVCEYVSKHNGWVQCRFFAMEREEGEPLRKVVFAVQVINDEKKELAENEKRISRAEMENKAKSAFLSNMTHEIRNPINTMLEMDEKIIAESSDAKAVEYARKIDNMGRILLALIDGILNTSELAAGKIELAQKRYSFRKMLDEVVASTRDMVEKKGLTYETDFSGDLPETLVGDADRLKQILSNLITNSVKFTEKGFVRLSVFGKTLDKKTYLLFSVKDSGSGMNEEDKARITERLAHPQAGSISRDTNGDDMEMDLMVRLLGLMGTNLNLITGEGEGSEFYFELNQETVDDGEKPEENE